MRFGSNENLPLTYDVGAAHMRLMCTTHVHHSVANTANIEYHTTLVMTIVR